MSLSHPSMNRSAVNPSSAKLPASRAMSLRNIILALALAPLLITAVLVLVLTFIQQTGRFTSLLIRAGAQSAATFGGGVQDLMDSSGQPLGSAEIQENVQMRLFDLVDLGAVPLNFAALYRADGEVVAAYDHGFSAGENNTVESSVLKQNFNKMLGDGQAVLSGYAKQAAAFQNEDKRAVPATVSGHFGGRDSAVIGYPLPGGGGSVVLGLDRSYISSQVLAGVLPTIVLILLIAGVLGVFAARFATSLSQRIQNLSARVDAISMGELDQPIAADQKDELGILAEAVERMRVSLVTVMSRM